MGAILVLPAITSEYLEVPLLSWAPDVPDPSTLAWRSAVSSTATRDSAAAPAVSDAVWRSTVLINRGTTEHPAHRVLVPLGGLTSGTYGVWVRVAGSTYASPARWAGQVQLR
jgi:hypothetical protein